MSIFFKSKKFLKVWAITASAVALATAVLRLVSILFFYDTRIGYYKSGAILPIIAQILPILAVISAGVIVCVPKLRPQPTEPQSSDSVKSFAIFPAAGFFAYAIVYLIDIFEYLSSGFRLGVFDIIAAFAFIGAALFFFVIFLGKRTDSAVFVCMGIAVVISLVYFLAGSYFDTLVQMNAPNKSVFQFALLSALLLAVNEMRVAIPEKRTKFHLFSATAAVIYLTSTSVPSIICFMAGKMPLNYSLFHEDCVLLMLAVFAFARLIQLCHTENDNISLNDISTEYEETTQDLMPEE